jgi:lysophospholipase L1-like esterase
VPILQTESAEPAREAARGFPVRFAIGLVLVTAAAAAVRVWGIAFGLPFLLHPDEGEVVNRALALPSQDLNPRWFVYPTLYLYVQTAAFLALYALQRLSGAVASYGEFAAAAVEDPTAVYTLGRAVTAAFGTAAVAATGLAARAIAVRARTGGTAAGLSAAALLCLSPLHVEHSHYVTTDVPVSLFAALLAFQAARMAGGGTARQYAVAGALVGLAASTKYPGALLGVLVAPLYVLEAPRSVPRILRDPRPLAALGGAAAGFLAGTPFALLTPSQFVHDVGLEAAHMQAGHLGFEAASNGWLAHLAGLHASSGLVFLVLVVAGGAALALAGGGAGRAIVVAAVVFFAAAGASRVLFARYLLPLMPIACVLAGCGLAATAEHMLRPGLLRSALALLLLVAALAVPATAVYHRLRIFAAEDTRAQAWHWAAHEGTSPGGVVVATERYAIPDAPAPPGVSLVPVVYDLEAVRESGARYVAVTDRMYRRYLRSPERYQAEEAFYGDLLGAARLVRVFSPYAGDAGRLVLGQDGRPRAAPPPGGSGWAALGQRLFAGPVIEVYALDGPAVSGTPRTDQNSALAHAELVEKARKGGIDVYFAGDSITRRWGTSDEQYKAFLENWRQNFFGWNAANFGWGGDTTRNILWRLENGELDGVNPKVIVLLAGTNDVGNASPTGPDDPRIADVVAGIEAILDVFRRKAPGATIVLMGITPRNDNPAVMPVVDAINERISKLADGERIRYVNINNRLAGRDGTFFEGTANRDGLHLDVGGYQVWADALKPILAELLGPPASVDRAPPPTGDPSAARRAQGRPMP